MKRFCPAMILAALICLLVATGCGTGRGDWKADRVKTFDSGLFSEARFYDTDGDRRIDKVEYYRYGELCEIHYDRNGDGVWDDVRRFSGVTTPGGIEVEVLDNDIEPEKTPKRDNGPKPAKPPVKKRPVRTVNFINNTGKTVYVPDIEFESEPTTGFGSLSVDLKLNVTAQVFRITGAGEFPDGITLDVYLYEVKDASLAPKDHEIVKVAGGEFALTFMPELSSGIYRAGVDFNSASPNNARVLADGPLSFERTNASAAIRLRALLPGESARIPAAGE